LPHITKTTNDVEVEGKREVKVAIKKKKVGVRGKMAENKTRTGARGSRKRGSIKHETGSKEKDRQREKASMCALVETQNAQRGGGQAN